MQQRVTAKAMRTPAEERAIGPRGTFVQARAHADMRDRLYNRARSTNNDACTRIALFPPFQVHPSVGPLSSLTAELLEVDPRFDTIGSMTS